MHSNIMRQGPENSDQTNMQEKVIKKHKPSQREKKAALILEIKNLNDQLAIEQEKEKQTKLDL